MKSERTRFHFIIEYLSIAAGLCNFFTTPFTDMAVNNDYHTSSTGKLVVLDDSMDIGGEVELFSPLSQTLIQDVVTRYSPTSPTLSTTSLKTKVTDSVKISSIAPYDTQDDDTSFIGTVGELRVRQPFRLLSKKGAKCWLEMEATKPHTLEDDDLTDDPQQEGSIIDLKIVQKKKSMNNEKSLEWKRKRRAIIRQAGDCDKHRLKSLFKECFRPLGVCYDCKTCGNVVPAKSRLGHLKRCVKKTQKQREALVKDLLTSLDNKWY